MRGGTGRVVIEDGPLKGWSFFWWPDGNQWWVWDHGNAPVWIERVVTKKRMGRRMKWHIVSRFGEANLYPPIIAGPFDNIKVAMLAARMMS